MRKRLCKICGTAERYKKTSSYCRDCDLGYLREWRLRNRDRMRAYFRQLYASLSERDKWNVHLRQRYGITADDYEQILTDQEGTCAICNGPPQRKRLSVDHCHMTGRVRGLLCERCNSILGRVKDDASILESAAAYLRPVLQRKAS